MRPSTVTIRLIIMEALGALVTSAELAAHSSSPVSSQAMVLLAELKVSRRASVQYCGGHYASQSADCSL
jgi:hypothetical protein